MKENTTNTILAPESCDGFANATLAIAFISIMLYAGDVYSHVLEDCRHSHFLLMNICTVTAKAETATDAIQ